MEMKNRELPPEALETAAENPTNNSYPDASSRDVVMTWVYLVGLVVLAVVGGYLLT